MGEAEIDNNAFLTSLANEFPRQMKFKASKKLRKGILYHLKNTYGR